MWEQRKQENAPTTPSRVNAAQPMTGSGTAEAVHSAPNGVTLIGKAMLIKGRIQSKQDLYVDGEVEGVLDATDCRLTIGPNGRAGGAKAREVEVLGVMIGDVDSAERVSVRKGGRLVGDVRTAGIVIEDGAFFKGCIDIVKRKPASSAPAVTNLDTAASIPVVVHES